MTAVLTSRNALLWIGFIFGMVVLPMFVTNSVLRTLIFANYLAIFAASWDVLSGRTGYISFGHPLLIGVGAYTTAVLTDRLDVPMTLSIPLAVVMAVAVGILFFLPALRVKGTYFALFTLAFMEMCYQLIPVIRTDLTGGTRGISGLDAVVIGAFKNYYLSLGLMIAICLSLWLILQTRVGTALTAIGMSEESVSGSGLSTTKLKLFAFVLGAGSAGLGGAFYVHYLGSIAPNAIFEINFLFTIIVAALLGGSSTIVGPMLGAFFLTFLLEWLRPVLPGVERYFIYGSIALVLYMYQPKGLYEIARLAVAKRKA